MKRKPKLGRPPNPHGQRLQVQISLSRVELDALDKFALDLGIDRTETIRRALTLAISYRETAAPIPPELTRKSSLK